MQIVSCEVMRASLVSQRSYSGKVTREVSLWFLPVDCYKSVVCRLAEESGCRWASHRRGYRMSLRAWARFCAALAEKAAQFPHNEFFTIAAAAVAETVTQGGIVAAYRDGIISVAHPAYDRLAEFHAYPLDYVEGDQAFDCASQLRAAIAYVGSWEISRAA